MRIKQMEIYLVGGAVRNRVLGIAPNDLDYVVIGSTPQQMLDNGFTQVGSDFPVFLHPQTKEEYALARTERKHGTGYNGFITDCSQNITLEEDLKRRDLTMNAIAMDSSGRYIDPFGGIKDIQAKIIRHVSSDFSDDPLRVLRTARFAAQLDFSVHPSTIEMLKSLKSEISSLTPERVWKELSKVLVAPKPERFFEVLFDAGMCDLFFESESVYRATMIELERLARYSDLLEIRLIAFRGIELPCLKDSNLKRLLSCARVLFNDSNKDIVDLYRELDYNRRPIPHLLNAYQVLNPVRGRYVKKCFTVLKDNQLTVKGLDKSVIPHYIDSFRRNLIANLQKVL